MDQRTPEKRIRMQHLHQDPEGVQVEDLEGETLLLIEDLQRGNRQVRASRMLGCCILWFIQLID
jgi:hypothetical protein